MFSPSILINYLGSSVIICLVGFQATAGVSPHEMFKFILFLIAQLAQIFIMCWYGNKVIESVSTMHNKTFFLYISFFFQRALESVMQSMKKSGLMLNCVIKNR